MPSSLSSHAFATGLLLLSLAAACAESNSKLTEDTTPGTGGTSSAGTSGSAGTSSAGNTSAGASGSESGGAGSNAGAGGSSGGAGGSDAGSGGSAGGDQGGAGGSDAGSGGSSAGTGGSGGSETAGSGGGTCTGKVLINEVSPEGPDGGNDDFVELYNPDSCPADIGGWTLSYSSATGSSPTTIWTASNSQKIPAKGFLVLGTTTFSGNADGELNSGLKQEGGGVGLKTDSGQLVDGIAWGTATKTHPFVEGSVCGTIPPSQSAARIPDGKDTDNNASDFTTPSTRSPGAPNFLTVSPLRCSVGVLIGSLP